MRTNSENAYVPANSKFKPLIFELLILCILYEEIIRMIVLKNGLIKTKISVISNLYVHYTLYTYSTLSTQIKINSSYSHKTILKWYKNLNNWKYNPL